ncbi:MAG: ABC transporter substrate-binding protein [Trueperaceae bacterium]|nr:ABC transporter substrate-binding protein [Trueperaceae bacterium]MCC6310310.1 ABC transporter substrate-binding protein [Trueperaceae bacterium]MCO5172630.1 ABC transporter substrate-binding protein [Trueperaceae bacterium]
MKRVITLLAAGMLLLGTAFAQAPADTYVYMTFGQPVSMDPARAYDTGSGGIIENVYETLMSYDGESLDVFVPSLATGYSVSADGLHWTFDLRPNVKFHSGNLMTCKDVAWSFKYGALTANPEGAPAYLMGNLWLGTDIDGSDPAAFLSEVTWDMIDGIVTCPEGPQGLKATVNLVNPTPALIPILTYTAFSIVDSQFAIAGGAWDGTEATWQDWVGRDLTAEFLHRNASGTGAFQLVDWTDDSVVADAFADYWGGAPALKHVIYRYVDEQSTRILAIQQGDADRITLNENSAVAQVEGAAGVSVLRDPNWLPASVTAAFFNFAIDVTNNEDVGSGLLDGKGIPSNFFADVNVRRGFAQLFDQQAFVDQVYQGQGTVITMGLPSSFLGYNPDVAVRTLDLEAAEDYFRAAFDGQVWEKGFEFTALYNSGNTIRQTALELIKDNLEFINPKFKMSVRGLPWADYLSRTAEKKAPMFALGWAADYADPSNFINTFYDDDGYYSARTSISVPEIQAIIDQADQLVDPEARGFLYRGIGTLHYDQAPLIAVPIQSAFLVVRSNLNGVYYNTMYSDKFLWKDLSKN